MGFLVYININCYKEVYVFGMAGGFGHVPAATMQNIPTTIIVINKNLCVREATRPTRSTSATNQSELGLKLIAPRALQAAA
jgi:hypothetical protein